MAKRQGGAASPLQEELEAQRLELESAHQELRAMSEHMQQTTTRLEQHGEYIGAVIDALSVPTLVLGPGLQVREANRAFLRGFQTQANQVIGRPLARVEGVRWDAPQLQAALGRVLRTGRPLEGFELQMASAQAGNRWLRINANRLPAPHEQMLVCSVENITARKRAEMLQLTRLELLGATSTALALVDGNQRIAYANAALVEMSGYSAEELMGENIHQKLHAFHPGGSRYLRPECPILAALRGGHAAGGEELFRRKSGAYFPVRWEVRPMQRALPGSALKRPRAGVLELHDISNERQVLHTLLTSEKQASTGRAAATIAHEINNPLGAIGNALYAIRALVEQPEMDRGRLAAMTSMAQAELERVSRIVQTTLGLYRKPEAAAPVDANAACQSALEMLQQKGERKRVRIRTHWRATRALLLPPGDLRQIVANLVGNAMEAVAEGGAISVGTYDTGSGVRILVGDNGPGIASELRPRIFQPFFTTKDGKGTGLGLWVTAEITRTLDGNLRVKTCTSEPSGTCFALTLPSPS